VNSSVTCDCNEEQQALKCVKEKLCEAAALPVPHPGETVTIVADVRWFSVGAYAVQNIDGCEQSVAYLSQKLLPNQMKWSTIKSGICCYMCIAEVVHKYYWITYSDLF